MPPSKTDSSLLQRLAGLLMSRTALALAKPLGEFIVARAALVPTSETLLNILLENLPGFTGHVDHIEFGWLHPICRLRGLTLIKESPTGRMFTLRIEQCQVHFQWRNLLRKKFIASMEIDAPVCEIDARATPDRRWLRGIHGFDFLITRLMVRRGEIRVVNVPGQDSVDLKASDLFLVAKNVTNSLILAPTLQADIECRAQVMDRGRFALTGSLYPFAEKPAFDLDMELRNVELRTLNPLLDKHLSVQVDSGTLEVFAEIAGDSFGFRGYLKPMAENLVLAERRGSTWERVKGKLADFGARFLKNKTVDRIATRIEFEGSWRSRQVATMTAIGHLLKNAFRTAFPPGIDGTIHFDQFSNKTASVRFDTTPETSIRKAWGLIKESASRWMDDDAARMSAALSYYATFSLAPLLVLTIAMAGIVFGRDAAQGHIVDQISRLVGHETAVSIQTMIHAAWRPAKGMAAFLSILTLLFGAMGALMELKQALNKIWRSPVATGFSVIVHDRLRSLALILGVGFLMLTSLVISASITVMGQLFGHILPIPAWVMQAINLALAFVITIGLFAMVYKVLPDTDVAWHDVWTGAAVTSALFSLGKYAIGLYLGRSGVSSAYGAAGSLIVILIWVYYSTMILYLGAEFTAIYAERYGSRRRRSTL